MRKKQFAQGCYRWAGSQTRDLQDGSPRSQLLGHKIFFAKLVVDVSNRSGCIPKLQTTFSYELKFYTKLWIHLFMIVDWGSHEEIGIIAGFNTGAHLGVKFWNYLVPALIWQIIFAYIYIKITAFEKDIENWVTLHTMQSQCIVFRCTTDTHENINL